jgi:hypothetical protein
VIHSLKLLFVFLVLLEEHFLVMIDFFVNSWLKGISPLVEFFEVLSDVVNIFLAASYSGDGHGSVQAKVEEVIELLKVEHSVHS